MARKDAEQNRRRILEVFEVLVRKSSSSPPTMSDVVRVSGLGRGTVYRHFPDIGSLAFETLTDGYRSMFREFRHDLAAVEGASKRIEGSLIHFLETFQAYSLDHRILILTRECQTSMAYAKSRESLRQLIAEALARRPGMGKARNNLMIRADLIARCVEAEHLRDSGGVAAQAQESIELAKAIMNLLNDDM